jgi:hypothetical protein
MDLSPVKTFVWTSAPDTVAGYGTLEWPDPHRSTKKDWMSTDMYYDMKPTGAETIQVFSNCVAAPTYATVAPPAEG